MLIDFEGPDSRWEELLIRSSRFQQRIEQARKSITEGRTISIEELREKHSIKSEDEQ